MILVNIADAILALEPTASFAVIDEDLDKVDTSKVEPEDDFKDREDKDIDNDGDTDDSDEYLHKKRQAISKAIKKESKSLKDVGGVVGIPALGDMIRRK